MPLSEAQCIEEQARVLAVALTRAATRLGVRQSSVARIIGVSEATVGRVFRGTTALSPQRKEGELALLLLRVFRSLDTVVGGDEAALRAWFHAHNTHLDAVPAEIVERVEGLVRVAEYLDAVRGTL
jgi:hypothetical protein